MKVPYVLEGGEENRNEVLKGREEREEESRTERRGKKGRTSEGKGMKEEETRRYNRRKSKM